MANFVLTITGADDEVPQEELARLSKEYSFVEWAILFSTTKTGTPRYPTVNWRRGLYATLMEADTPINLAAHLCGQLADDRAASFTVLHTEIETFYRRVQFNRFNFSNAVQVFAYAQTMDTIVPINDKTEAILEKFMDKSKVSGLFDKSGGRGVSPSGWPEDRPEYHLVGYAGGIGEDNIEATLEFLAKRYDKVPFWVDLETKARNEKDEFDLAKVERILAKAKPFFGDQYEPKRIVLLSDL